MSVAEDIVSIKEAIAGEWDDILTTAGHLDTMISDAISWFEANETDFWTNSFEPAIQQMIAEFKEIDKTPGQVVKDVETAISNGMETVKSDFTALTNAISTLEGDIDGLKAFETLLDSLPTFPDIIPGIDAAAVKAIFEEVLGDRFSVAIKKIPDRTAAAEGSQGQPNQNAAAESALETLLKDAFYDNFTTNVITNYARDIEGIATNIKALVESSVVTDLENAAETIIEEIVSKPEKLTLDYLETTVSHLLSDQWQNAITLANGLETSLQIDLGKIRTILNEILTLPAAADCDFVKFYQLIINDDTKVPTLQEAVCLIVAIPLTMSSQAITGSNFTFPQSAYLTFDATARAKMSGLLGFIGIGIALGDKAYTTVTGSDGFWHTVAMGITGTVQGALSQVAFSPINPTPITADNLLWYYNWGASFGFSLVKWVYKAYWQYNNPGENALTSTQSWIENFINEFDNTSNKLTSAYHDLSGPGFTQYIPKHIYQVSTDMGPIQADVENVTQPEFKKGLQDFVAYKLDTAGIEDDISKLIDSVKISQMDSKVKLKAITKIADIGSQFNGLEQQFNFACQSAKNVLTKSYSSSHHNDILGSVPLVIDVQNSLLVLAWQVYLYNKATEKDKLSLGKQVFVAAKAIFSDIVSLYYLSKKPLTEEQEKHKSGIEFFMFVVNQLWAGFIATGTLDFQVAFKSMEYDQNANTLTVAFNYDVSLASGATWKSAFDLENVNDINPVAGSNSSFIITLNQALTEASVAISVVANQLLDPWNNKVVASKTFDLPTQLSTANYDAGAKTISVSFDFDVTQVTGKDSYFNLGPSGTITSVTPGANNSFTLALKDVLLDGPFTLSTTSAAFTDAKGNPVDSSINFTVTKKTNS